MYTIAGDVFYSANDDKNVLIDAFVNTRLHYYMRNIPKGVDAKEIVPESMEGYRQIAEDIYNKSPDSLAFAINQEAIYDKQIEYERHWMDFLMNSLRFDSRIVKFDSSGVYGALTMNCPVSHTYESFLASINGASYLVINRRSEIVSDNGRALELSDGFISKIKSIFLDTTSTMDTISIKYAPLMDTSGIYTLNRILHLYL